MMNRVLIAGAALALSTHTQARFSPAAQLDGYSFDAYKRESGKKYSSPEEVTFIVQYRVV
jgi:hypothetical protein